MATFASSLSSILRSCIPLSAITQARQTHVQILIHGLNHDVTLQTDLLLAYSRCGFLDYARKVFDGMLERNMHSWNIMVSAYVQNSLHHDALAVFADFLNTGLKPDHYSLPPVLKACAGIGDLWLGVMLHSLVVKLGFENYVVVGSSLLDFYSKCGNLKDAMRVFVGLSWKDSVSWNSMISGFVKAGLHQEALSCFRDMLGNRVKMDSMTIPSLISACGKLGDITKGKEIHGQVLKNTALYSDVAIGNSLIDLYSKCGSLSNAEKVFCNIKDLNLVSWTTMISCYGVHGKGDESLILFEKMKDSGLQPNSVTLTAILASCSHSGLVQQGKKIFNSIDSLYGSETSVEHYACMVDLLSRFGCFEEALRLISSMKMAPPASVWGALLSGSLVHKNVEIGEIAANHLFELEPRNASNYIALCSLYDSRSLRTDGSRVRSKMRRRGLNKTPGCSWVTVGGEVHTFYQGDLVHSLDQKTCEKLEGVLRTLMLYESSTHLVS